MELHPDVYVIEQGESESELGWVGHASVEAKEM